MMKNLNRASSTNFFVSFLMASFFLFAFSSCAKKIVFPTSTVVPAAQGSVKIKKDKNKNYTLDVTISNLAEPKRLDPPKETYVVWMETEGNGTRNIGQINSSSGFLSSKLKASLHAVTPFKPIRIFITAEDNANVQYPGMMVVLRTDTFN
ncbi:MAG: hypothetical protein ABIN57_08600 [Chitinophagaceae bacterium]